jgi:DNA-binding winged helix-turn-helix (wHTH) protein
MIHQGTRSAELEALGPLALHAGPFHATGILHFGDFMLKPSARVLLLRGKPVELGSRAFDLLVILLRRRGGIVSKEEIVSYVWPTTVVEESNLRFQMATLRRALGKWRDLIKTIPGRGYLFIADSDDPATGSDDEMHDHVDANRHRPSDAKPAVFLINEDVGVRNAICQLLRRFDVEVQPFSSLAAAAMGSQHVGDGSADCMERPTL